MNKIIKYITDRQPLLNISQLERLAGMPNRSIHKAINGSHALSEKYWLPIIRTLCQSFGTIEMDGWTIWCDTEGPAIITKPPAPDKDVEIIEPEEGRFEYIVTEQRSLYDEFDFINYFLKNEST